MIMEIECIPRPPGTADDRWKHVDAAIAVVQESGLHYEVNALGTVFEGSPNQCWDVARRVHEACLASGAEMVLTALKVEQMRDPAEDVSMEEMTRKFRT